MADEKKVFSSTDTAPAAIYAKRSADSETAYPLLSDDTGALKVTGVTVNINLSQDPTITGLYFGDQVTDGSWRIVPSGSSLLIQRLEIGVWVEKTSITS
jgi:type IV secretory pathway VirB9-like protein